MYVCMCVGSGAPERSPPWYVLSWCVHSTQQKLLCTFFCARLPPAQRNPEEEEEEPAIHTIPSYSMNGNAHIHTTFMYTYIRAYIHTYPGGRIH